MVKKYGFTDDYSAIYYAKFNPDYLIKSGIGQGRPFLGAFIWLQYKWVSTFSHLRFIHLISSVILSMLCLTIYRIYNQALDPAKYSTISKVLLSLAPLLLIPSTIVWTGWLIEISPLISCLLSAFALLRVVSARGNETLNAVYLCLPILLYQLAAAWVGSLCLVVYIFSSKNIRVRLIHFLKLKSSILVLSIFSVLEVISFYVGVHFKWITGTRSSLTTHPIQKLQWLIRDYFPGAINIINPWNRHTGSLTALTIILGFLFIATFLGFGKEKFYLILLAILSAMLPNLISADMWASNRSLFAIQWVLYTCAFFTLHNIIKNLPKIVYSVAGIFAVVIFLQWYNLGYLGWAKPQVEEIKKISMKLDSSLCEGNIHVIPSFWTDTISGKVSYDEFGLPSSSQAWSAVPLAKMICTKEYPLNRADFSITDKFSAGSNFAEIDFGKFLKESKK